MLDDIVFCEFAKNRFHCERNNFGIVVSRDLSSPPGCSIKYYLGRIHIKIAIGVA